MTETALTYIFTDDGDKRFVGCGALVEGGFIATCRHVWRMATENEDDARQSVVVEFPEARYGDDAPLFRAAIARACDEHGKPDLVLLKPTPEPDLALPLALPREERHTKGEAFGLAAPPSRDMRSFQIDGTVKDHRSRKDGLQQFSCASGDSNYWPEKGSSGAPFFLRQGIQLAGLLVLADVPALGKDPQSGRLREALMLPDDIIWTHVAAAMAAPVAEHVPAESLRNMLEELGQQDVAAADIPARLTKAFAAMKASAARPVAQTNAGGDIDETIADARQRLDALDPVGALALIKTKRDAIADIRKDATGREIALLTEQVSIQRLSFDHAGAIATLAEIVRLDAENAWALVEMGDTHSVAGERSQARMAFEKALAIVEGRFDERHLSVVLSRLGDVRVAEGDRAGALDAYAKALAIREELARRDPGNAEWQRDLSVSLWRIADLGENAAEDWGRVVAIYEALDRAGRLAPPDRPFLDEARRRRDAAA